MPEVKVAVVPVGIKYLCDSCGDGYMAREDIGLGGSMLLTNPPKYKHECNSCGAEEYFTETYPTVRFEFKEVEQPAPARKPLSDEEIESVISNHRFAYGVDITAYRFARAVEKKVLEKMHGIGETE